MEMFEYILKVNICITAIFLFYRIFLVKDTFFTHNRFFLLLVMPLIFAFPLVDISFLFPYKQSFSIVNNVIQDINTNLAGAKQSNLQKYCLLILASVSAVLFLRFLMQLCSLIFLYIKSEKEKLGAYKLVKLEKQALPFSFGKCIFINSSLFSEEELLEIIFHEEQHCKQLHTIDVLLYEMLVILFWFNPFVWLLRRSMKENLEFLTDDKVLKAGFNKKTYQYLLLKVNQNEINLSITNCLKFNHLKKRITMMNKNKKSKTNLLKFGLLVPVFAIMTLVVNAQEIKENIVPESRKEITTMIHDFGEVEESEDIFANFSIENTGNDPIVINSANASCGCTTPEWSNQPILPNKSTTVKVLYDTKGRLGLFDKIVTVKLSNSEEIILRIKGNVLKKGEKVYGKKITEKFTLNK